MASHNANPKPPSANANPKPPSANANPKPPSVFASSCKIPELLGFLEFYFGRLSLITKWAGFSSNQR